MRPFSFILDNFLRGKEYYIPLRRLLDMLLSLSITSFLFQNIYFSYSLLDISDYKGIINFFMSGQFFVPLFLFLLVHFVCYLIAYGFFSFTTTIKTTMWREEIISYNISEKKLNKAGRMIKVNQVITFPEKINSSWFIQSYNAIKDGVSREQWD
jgi:hypothetical protein